MDQSTGRLRRYPPGRPRRRPVPYRGYGTYATGEAIIADDHAWEQEICAPHGLTSEAAFRQWLYRHYAQGPYNATKLANALSEVVTVAWP